MVAPWNSFSVRLLALVAALPWPALLISARTSTAAPAGSTPPVIAAGDESAAIGALPAERKPGAKGDRGALNGKALPTASRTPLAATKMALPEGVRTLTIANTNHPSCALLCRFLV